MECHSIKEKLSAYIETQLSSEEKKQMDEHLRGCPKCRHDLENLKKTIAYTQGLKEIEPPPWLTQKIMTKVKEEAEQRKGILQKLFFPLHIKVPIEVVATIAIAVTTIYVFKTIQPEIKLTETPSKQVIVPEQEEKKRALTKDESLAYKEAFPEVPEPVEKRRLEKEADVIAGKAKTAEKPAVSAGEKTIPQESAKALDMEVKEKAKGLAPELKAVAERKEDSISLTVNVKDIESAKKEIDKVLTQLGGKIIKTESFENKDILTAELDFKKMKELFEKLRLIGEVKEKDALYALKVDATRSRGDMEIKIEIVKVSIQLQ